MDYLAIVRTTLSIISLLSSLFIIITILFIKNLWTFHFRLILYLAISNCITSVAFILPYPSSHLICTLQGLLDNFGSLSSLIWTAFIMYSLFKLVIYEEICSLKLELIFAITCWTLSLAISLIGFKHYKDAKGWCWINDNWHYSLICFYAEFFFILMFDLYICIRIYLYIKSSSDLPDRKKAKKAAFKRFIWYPIILVLCYVPSTAHRFYPGNSPTLNLFGILGNTLYGLACALAYGNTKFVRKKISSLFSKSNRVSSSLISIKNTN